MPQLYLTDAPDGQRMRLLRFKRVELEPGESRKLSMIADPRLLARFDGAARQWRIAEGIHRVMLGKSARESVLTAEATLDGRLFGS